MESRPDSIALSQDELRLVGYWAADCAERALSVFEARAPSDPRPREAIEGGRVFAHGGKRTARLRSLAWAAYASAREVGDPAAAAAARAAGLVAGVAYMHPLATPHQSKHALGPVAYAALARELAEHGDSRVGDGEIRRAIEHASAQMCDVVCRMPDRGIGRGRLDALL
ncbi:MAG: putative immunity protein, partial [bacterium]